MYLLYYIVNDSFFSYFKVYTHSTCQECCINVIKAICYKTNNVVHALI